MGKGLIVKVVEPDDDYLGIDISASNERYAGTARIYAKSDELGKFATLIAGFPQNPEDERTYEFGTRDERYAGGYCFLRFYTMDAIGHSALEVDIEDDKLLYGSAKATLRFKVEAAHIDEFVRSLRKIEREKAGEASLPTEGLTTRGRRPAG